MRRRQKLTSVSQAAMVEVGRDGRAVEFAIGLTVGSARTSEYTTFYRNSLGLRKDLLWPEPIVQTALPRPHRQKPSTPGKHHPETGRNRKIQTRSQVSQEWGSPERPLLVDSFVRGSERRLRVEGPLTTSRLQNKDEQPC